MDMSVKYVHYYPEMAYHIKDRSTQKVETWNKSFRIYYIDNQGINFSVY